MAEWSREILQTTVPAALETVSALRLHYKSCTEK